MLLVVTTCNTYPKDSWDRLGAAPNLNKAVCFQPPVSPPHTPPCHLSTGQGPSGPTLLDCSRPMKCHLILFCMAECNMLPNASQKIRQEWKHSIISEFCPSRSIPLKHGWQWCESKFPSIFIHIFENKNNSETKWVFPKIGVPQNGWFIRENPIKMDDLGVLFLETSKYTPRGSNRHSIGSGLMLYTFPTWWSLAAR